MKIANNLKKLVDLENIHEGMAVISAIGNRGKIVQKTTTTKNENDFWIKILWENGNVSSGPWSERERWRLISIP